MTNTVTKIMNKQSDISLGFLYPSLRKSPMTKLLVPLMDRVVGLAQLSNFYRTNQLDKYEVGAFPDKMLDALDVQFDGFDQLADQLPKQGSTIIVSNHPYGCVEGVALANALKKIRGDVKVLANVALSMFQEIQDLFIFIDPINPNNPKNIAALRNCKQHLNQGGCLVIFPAGKVAEYSKDCDAVVDLEWNRIAAHLTKATDSPVLPVHFSGHNSSLFINAGRVWAKLKLVLLFRELLKSRGKTIKVNIGHLLSTKLLANFKSTENLNDYLRLQVYLLDSELNKNQHPAWLETQSEQYLQDIAAPTSSEKLQQEIDGLPSQQKLANYKGFDVFYGQYDQMPNVVREIARQRERVFREHNEGSGNPIDSDEFDQTYTHLFICDQDHKSIIGAYRMGRTDIILKNQGIDGLYLSKMFDFKENFINCSEPCLEMGRSFIVPEHQKSFYGLYLLWRGIGAFVVKHPEYRKLYGTVSISKLYSPLSVLAIQKTTVRPCQSVQAKVPFQMPENKAVEPFWSKHKNEKQVLSAVVKGIESDGKDLPILLKQYEKMAARFYCIGLDKSFNNTPGMLLCVDMPKAPIKMLKQYLGDGLDSYLRHEKYQTRKD